jgi:hypothetical protein
VYPKSTKVEDHRHAFNITLFESLSTSYVASYLQGVTRRPWVSFTSTRLLTAVVCQGPITTNITWKKIGKCWLKSSRLVPISKMLLWLTRINYLVSPISFPRKLTFYILRNTMCVCHDPGPLFHLRRPLTALADSSLSLVPRPQFRGSPSTPASSSMNFQHLENSPGEPQLNKQHSSRRGSATRPDTSITIICECGSMYRLP